MSISDRIRNWTIVIMLLFGFSVAGAQAPFSRGVNLTGWFQANSPREIKFTRFTEKDITDIKSLGCDVIRLPINLHNMTSGPPDYRIDPLFYSFLDSVITWCEKQNIYLILDNHTFDPNVNTDPGVADILVKVWGQMALRYKERSKYVLYEVLNEPHGITTSSWGTIQGQTINAIRAYDTKHTIVVGGSGYNSYNELPSLQFYADTNLLYTFHFYDPFIFTHQGATWVIPSMAPLSGVPFPYNSLAMPQCPTLLKGTWVESGLNNYGSDGTVSSVRHLIDIAINFRNSRNVKIYCGEFGVFIPNSNNSDRCRWYKVVSDYLEANNVPWTTWDYKDGFGLFNNGSNELFGHDLNVQLLDSLGLYTPPQTPFVMKPDTTGFMIFDDYIKQGIVNASYGSGSIDFYYKNLPEAGTYCLDWSGFSQYNALVFDFAPDKDLSRLVSENYALDFMVRGSATGIKFEIRFRDSKTGPSDHPWRMGTTVDGTTTSWDLKWHHVRIPLSSFNERGAWDNNTWFNPEGKFDWTKVDVLEISTEWTDILGKRLWFDNINISNLDTAVVRVNDAVGISDIHASGDLAVSIAPNPMKNYAEILFYSLIQTPAEIYIFSITGYKVRTLLKTYINPGKQLVNWDGRSENGTELPPGIYICRITTKSTSAFCKIVKN